jgi:hypothetical protein
VRRGRGRLEKRREKDRVELEENIDFLERKEDNERSKLERDGKKKEKDAAS